MKIKKLVLFTMVMGSLAACSHTRHEHHDNVASQVVSTQQLGAYNWLLTDAVDKQGRPLGVFGTKTLMLNFDNRHLNILGGCNNISAPYQLNNGSSTNATMQIKATLSTMKACAPELMAQDTAVTKFMRGQELSINLTSDEKQPHLQLVNERGDRLVWRGVLTDAAQYGQATVVFWEVSDKTQSCETERGLAQCIKVRDIIYNDQGVKVKTGAWHDFSGKIEGWEFNPNEKQVLRINIYRKKQSGENALNTYSDMDIYKLDQIIERRVVEKRKHK